MKTRHYLFLSFFILVILIHSLFSQYDTRLEGFKDITSLGHNDISLDEEPQCQLPPGSFGLPFLGENLLFALEGPRFFLNRAREYNSTIFRTHLFFEKTIALVGAPEVSLFFDTERLSPLAPLDSSSNQRLSASENKQGADWGFIVERGLRRRRNIQEFQRALVLKRLHQKQLQQSSTETADVEDLTFFGDPREQFPAGGAEGAIVFSWTSYLAEVQRVMEEHFDWYTREGISEDAERRHVKVEEEGHRGTRAKMHGGSFAFQDAARRLFTDLGVRFVWGLQGVNRTNIERLSGLLEEVFNESYKHPPLFYPPLLDYLGTSSDTSSLSAYRHRGRLTGSKARRELENFLLPLVTEAIHLISSSDAEEGDEYGKKPIGFEPEELVAELVFGMVRSHYSLANYATFLMTTFAHHPQVWSRVRREVNAIVNSLPWQSSSGKGFAFTPEMLNNMTYLAAVIKEIRRFYPLTPLLVGKVSRSFIYKGYCFPKDWRIIIDVHATKRDPSFGWSNPDEFDPDRWLRKSGTPSSRIHSQAHTLVPSTKQGAKTCSQPEHFKCQADLHDTMLLKLMASILVQNYQWNFVRDQDFEYGITAFDNPPRPKDGVLLSHFSRQLSSSRGRGK